MSQQALRQVLPQLPISLNRNVLVSSKTFDDAGVYRLDRHRALVQTVDFFTPIVDDPFSYGQIAAANSLSDIYAMGGRPLTALNIIGFPDDLVRPRVVSSILRGGLAKAAEVGCVIIGGHSIRNPEPIYGLAVTGLVDVRRVTTNANARPGDVLVLTKPLGTGIATTAIKRGMASRALQKNVIALMSQINTVGAELAELWARARRHRYHRLRADRASDLVVPGEWCLRGYRSRCCADHQLRNSRTRRIWAAFRKEAGIISMEPRFLSIGRERMRRAKFY